MGYTEDSNSNVFSLHGHAELTARRPSFDPDDFISQMISEFEEAELESDLEIDEPTLSQDEVDHLLDEPRAIQENLDHCFKLMNDIEDRLTRMKFYLSEMN